MVSNTSTEGRDTPVVYEEDEVESMSVPVPVRYTSCHSELYIGYPTASSKFIQDSEKMISKPSLITRRKKRKQEKKSRLVTALQFWDIQGVQIKALVFKPRLWAIGFNIFQKILKNVKAADDTFSYVVYFSKYIN